VRPHAPQAPIWKVTANFHYSHDLGTLPFQAALQGALTYQGSQNFSLSRDPETAEGGYTIVNRSLGIRQRERRYEVMFFINKSAHPAVLCEHDGFAR
jgi:iron complex outermembrane receptor protein